MSAEKKRKMSAPASFINEVKVWLNSQHIRVSLDWVEACVEFLNHEFQIPYESGSLQRLKNGVYEQWLAADLQEIGVQCLPSDLSVAQKTTLQGSYALQINGVRDIGKSAYSQLKQLDGAANENAEVSATPKPSVPEWEAKPTRMLMLNLTDGINCVQGMEYRPISFLTVDLPAGVKAVIQGPVDCRFGVLLLTTEKIRILGGEVESLTERYSKEAVLREVLQLQNENDEVPVQNGHSENQQITRPGNESNVMQNMRSTPVQKNMRSILVQQNMRSTPVQQNTRSTPVQQNRPQISSSSYQSSAIPGRSAIPQSHHPQNNDGEADYNFEAFDDIENIDFDNFEDEEDDAFMRSIDYDALDKIERESFSQALPENDDFDFSEDEEIYQEVMALQENTRIEAKRCKKSLPEQSKEVSSTAGNKLVSPVQNMSSTAGNKLVSPVQNMSSTAGNKLVSPVQNMSSTAGNKLVSPVQNMSSPHVRVQKSDQDHLSSANHVSYTTNTSSFDKWTVSASNISPSSTARISSTSASSLSPSMNQKISGTSGVSSSVNKPSMSTSSEFMSSNSRTSSSSRLSEPSKSGYSVSPKTSFTPSVISSINKQPVTTLNSASSVNSTALPQPSASLSPSVSHQVSSQGHNEDKSYTSLSTILQNRDTSSEFTATIKAHIGATLSRLECSSTLGWQLTVKLDDGTGTIEVMMHDKVLEEFVGIPAKDMVSLKTQAGSNVEIRNRIMEAVTNCKKKLQSLNCQMEIKFSPNLPKPCVIKCFL